MKFKDYLTEQIKGAKKAKKVGKNSWKCPWDGTITTITSKTNAKSNLSTTADWGEHCNIAIKLDCGHYMFDDCMPLSLNGMVAKDKNI